MKKKARKSTKTVKELSKQEEVAHYTAIIVEDLKSSFNMVIEKVDGLEESLNHKMDVKFAEQNLRFDRIEFVLGQHGDTLKEHGGILGEHSKILNEHSEILGEHSKILGEHSEILGEHSKILGEHSEILGEHSKILGEHSETLGRLETKFDILAKKVDHHDEVIQEIQQQLSHE